MPKLNDKYKKAGQVWVVTCVAAGIITLSAGNGKRPDKILYPSELEKEGFIKVNRAIV